MAAMTVRIAMRAASRALRVAAAVAVLAMALPPAHAAKDTPFGAHLVGANFPNSTVADIRTALALSAEIGGHSCFTWHWGDVNSPLAGIVALPPLMREYGLKSVIQLGATFLGNPAPPPGYVPSFGNSAVRGRFLSDISAVAAAKPDYVIVTTEANLMFRFNRAEFENFRTLYASAYYLIKAASPKTKVGASFLYSLWFLDYVVNDIDVPALLQPADFVAFTTYPEWLVREGHYPDIASIQPEFHGAAREAYPNKAILWSEVGWASKGRGTPALQQEFMRNLPRILSATQPELVTWALLYDVEFFQRNLLAPSDVQFLENLGVDIDSLFEHFNGMGLLDGFGNPKPALQDARELVFPVP